MRIQLSEHFTYRKLLRFTLPSIVMMVFTSIYSVVDGLFVSNYVGKTPFAAINLLMPLLMILGALGFMVGTGGSALVAKTMGEGNKPLANRYFSLLVYVTLILGSLIALLGQWLLRPAAAAMGATGEMLEDCVTYGRITLASMPCFMLQNVFQTFFVTAEKPKLGLAFTVAAGLTNVALDALLVAGLGWGLAGAALATSLSEIIGGLTPVFYFARKNDSLLRLGKTRFYGRALLKTCWNGSSELMSSIASSVVTLLYNYQLLRLAGDSGVAAFGAVMYVSFFFAAIFIGYSSGSAPIVSYHYGAGHPDELKSLLRKSLTLIALTGAAMTALAAVLASPLARLFTGYDEALCQLTTRGMLIYAFSFLLCGFSIYGSSFFTALNDGGVSAAISFLRTLVFETASVLILPALLGLDGVWLAALTAELCAVILTTLFLLGKRKKYRYA